MRVRRFITEQDYPIVKGWWERRGAEAPPEGILPMTGVIAEMDGVPVACAFLYEDKGGRVAMVEWEATNPDVASAMAHIRALNVLFDFFEKYWHGIILSWVAENRGDGRILDRRGWKACPGERHKLMAFVTKKEEALCPQS